MSATTATSMKIPEISSVADRWYSPPYHGLLPTFIMEGNAIFQYVGSENRDVIFFPSQMDRLPGFYF